MILSPAEYVIRMFHGVRPLSKQINRSASSISHWRKSGHIPHKAKLLILKLAKYKELDITPDDLINGRDITKA